ncbi:MAG: lysozyme [Rhodospirillales bacterium]|nr:lysozyme [Rhodospirillales bacterium]
MSNSIEPSGSNLEEQTAEFTEGWEGFESCPYQDSGGTWTIGCGSTRDINNNPVTQDTPCISKQEATDLLARDLKSSFDVIAQDVSVPLTDNEKEALADFIYNVGQGNFASSTLLRLLNEGNYTEAAQQFLRWKYVHGQVIAGLLNRRVAEMKMFET